MTDSSLLPPELRDQLPRRIAHALRTPLGLVQTALQELEGSAGDDPLLALGHRGVRQLARLADRLSLLARLERGEHGPMAAVDLLSLLTQAMEDVARTRPRKSIRTTRGPMPARALVRAEAPALRAALAELLDNAVRFARGSVEVRARSDDGRIIVEIDDDGPGPAAAPTTGAGLGLGLVLADAIVARHGGQVELRPGPTGGARASLVLDTTPES